MNRLFRLTGSAACLVAVLVTLGGHWLALQSFAWARMLADFSRQDGLIVALSKTFDGKHPCALCLGIQRDRQQEQRERPNPPGAKPDRDPDLFCEVRRTPVPLPLWVPTEAVPVVPRLHSDFIESPPTPPPRHSSGRNLPVNTGGGWSRFARDRSGLPAPPQRFPDARFRVAPIVRWAAVGQAARHLDDLFVHQWRSIARFQGLESKAMADVSRPSSGSFSLPNYPPNPKTRKATADSAVSS